MKIHLIVLFLTLTTISAEENDHQIFLQKNSLFTASVYKEVLKNGDNNFLVSPFSVEVLLALAQSGARGQTAQELRTSLHLPDDQDKIEATFKNLLPKLRSQDLYSLKTANKLYLEKNFSIKDSFKKVASDVFHADLENIQFLSNTEAATTMNQWVEEQTENKIRNLIDPKGLNENTVAILINALYFKGNWSFPFAQSFTKKRHFYQFDKKNNEVDTMILDMSTTTFKYVENDELGAKFLELPFQGENVSMVFVLPNEENGIENLEKQIDKVFVPQNFTQEYVNISLPKFKTESKIDFKKVLKELGVETAFTMGVADFSGISDKNLVISDVFQKTYIDVNEDGVEAAAASYAQFNVYSVHYLPTEPKQFHADHPFIYYIQINGLVVFAGRVGAPSY